MGFWGIYHSGLRLDSAAAAAEPEGADDEGLYEQPFHGLDSSDEDPLQLPSAEEEAEAAAGDHPWSTAQRVSVESSTSWKCRFRGRSRNFRGYLDVGNLDMTAIGMSSVEVL